MNDIKQQIITLLEKYQSLVVSLKIDEKKTQAGELEGKTTDPTLWENQENARKILQDFADLKAEIKEVEEMGEEVGTLSELAKEDLITPDLEKDVIRLQKALEKLTLKSFLDGAYDVKNAIVQIHAGQGGTEAMDWTAMLLRMYLRYCERKGWTAGILDSTPGEEAGVKSVIFSVSGKYAYGFLKYEAGTHRLVRQSPFNADKLRQTSFSLVEVLPEFEDVDLPDIEINEDDIEIQFFHSSSQGGQNVQKVSTAVRITHKPTGIVVTSQRERFQEQNRKLAMNLLKSKLWALEQEKAKETKNEIRGEYRPASWGNQIRSYVLHPYKMVKDLRTQMETSNTEAFLDGELDEFIQEEIKNL
jgi:peptide chain release factor 2